MINNRQGGRRRGRGGQRPQNLGGRPDGNRQDNRQRGNAAQLLEKYKSMARDSQLAGDRVQTEYYLQFADHYFRVLGESRAKFEDQRRQRGDDSDEDAENNSSPNEFGFSHGDEDMLDADDGQSDGRDDEQSYERPQRRERADNGDRGQRPQRSDGGDRGQRVERTDGGDRGERADGGDRGRDRPQRVARDERSGVDSPERGNGGRRPTSAESIPFDVLPPAIGRDEPVADVEADDDAPRPRRRLRRPRAEGEDIAPVV